MSRQGGDEFLILLSEVAQADDPAIVARRILRAVGNVHIVGEHTLHVTTSIGVSVCPDDGTDAETLIKHADIAMYQAKKDGRNGVQFFEPAMNVRAIERQFIEESLRSALELQEFSLHYQPKIDLRNGRITGAEALIRWVHPTRGMVSPAQFIPVAVDTGLIVPIGKWVLREACRQARAWADAGLSLPSVAVNISAIELRSTTFLKDVLTILEETGLDPRALELELTESVLMTHAQSNASILKDLRAKGDKEITAEDTRAHSRSRTGSAAQWRVEWFRGEFGPGQWDLEPTVDRSTRYLRKYRTVATIRSRLLVFTDGVWRTLISIK